MKNVAGSQHREDGKKGIADSAHAALTLMMAESKPDEKDLLCKLWSILLMIIIDDTIKASGLLGTT